IQRGDLRRYDIIILPKEGEDEILRGHAPGTMPAEYTGGVGPEGAAALKRYVEGGGWLLAIDEAADFAIHQFGLPIRNVVADLRPQEFFIPGSLIRIRVDSANPLAYGMPEEAIAFFVRSQVFDVVPPAIAGEKRAP